MVYLIKQKGKGNFWKIGHSKDPAKRLQELQVGNPNVLELKYIIQSKNSELLEREIHNRLGESRVRGEWFVFSYADRFKLMKVLRKSTEVLSFKEYSKKCKVDPKGFATWQALSPVMKGSVNYAIKMAFRTLVKEGTGFISYAKLGAMARVKDYQAKNAMYSMLLVDDLFEYNTKVKQKSYER